MPDNNKEKVVSSWEEAEKDDVVSSWEEAESSPKSNASSNTGGESGARITPSTSTLPSAGSESESWTKTINPLASTGATRSIDAVEQTKITKPKYEPNNFGEILKKAKIGVINPDLDEVVNQSKPMNVGGVEISVRDMGEPAPMQRSVPKKEVDQDIDLLVKRTNVVRKLREQEIDKAKQFKLGLEQLKQEGADLNEQYKANPTPELEAQLNQTVKDLQDTEKAYNRAAFAQDIYEKRILQTSDSIKKLANDKVPQDFFSGFYSGMKDNLESRGKAYDLATMGKAEQIQYAKDQALKAPSIRVGDRVQWVANGEEKFDEPLKIRRISDDGSTAFILVNGVENQIPLEQLEKPTSLMAEGGQMLGGVAPDITEAIGWSLAGLPFIGAASVAARQGAQQATEDFSRVFNEVKSSGLPTGKKDLNGRDIMREATDDEAYDIAIKAAGIGAATGAAEGLVGTLGGGKIVKAVANKARTQGGKIIAEKALDTASDAAIAGGMQVTRNAFDQYQGIDTKITEGVGETMLGEAVLSVPMNTFSGVKEYSKAKKETAVREVFKAINESKSNPYELQKLQSNLDVLKNQGMISNVDYNELNKKAEDYIRVVETIPTEVLDKQKAADLIIERDELEAKKESVDKAFQKPINEKINAINDELVAMATPVELQKNTSSTPERWGTINRNDGKGVVNLTKEEFEAEQAKMQQEEEGTAPVEEAPQVEEGSVTGGEVKQKELEDKIDEIKGKRAALRGEDGNVPADKMGEWNKLGKELNQARVAASRGNTKGSILIKKKGEGETSDPTFLSKEEKEEAADLIEQVIQNSKTVEEAVKKVNRLGYVFDLANADLFARYLSDRYNSDAPQVGNNKSSFQEWVNGVQPKADGIAPAVEQTEEQIANNEYISNAISESKDMLQKHILSEEEYIKKTEDKKGRFRKGLEKLFGDGNYYKYLKEQKENLSLLNKNPLAYYEKMLGNEIKWKEKNPEDASEYNIGWYENIIDKIKQQQATPKATAGETIKTTTNEKANEDGEQKRGKDGEENVPKSLQSEGEVGGNEVDLEEKQVLAPEGAVTAAPIENPKVLIQGTRQGTETFESSNYDSKADGKVTEARVLTFDENGVSIQKDNKGNQIVHIKVDATDSFSRRGNLQVSVIVPEGTNVNTKAIKEIIDAKVAEIKAKGNEELRLGKVQQSDFTALKDAIVNELKNPSAAKSKAEAAPNVEAGSVVGGENPALKDETPILSTPKILSTDGLPDLEIVASKEANQALESEIGGDKGVIDKNVRTIPIQEYDVASNKRSKQIAEQIEENGWIEPLIVSYDKSGNVYIVEGQHRAAALKELGYDKAPVIVIHEKNLGKQPIQEAPKTEQQTKPITNEKSSQKTDQEGSTEGGMLEEPRDGGTQDEGGKKSTELRTEEKEVVAVEGSTVKLPPSMKGGMERTMVFKDGEWQQSIGGSPTKVGDKVKAEANEAFKASQKAEPVVEAGSNVEVKSAYGNFLLNEIDKRHKEKYNGEDIKSALAKQFNETLADRGENRAISNLEDTYMNYVPDGVKTEAYQVLRKNFEKQQSLKEAPKTETTPTVEAPKVEAKEEEVTPTQEEVVEEEEEQYEPITVSGTSHDTFTKDNAVDYEEDEKEGDNGRSYTYLSSVTVELIDDNSGDTIGTISKLKSEDGEVTYSAEDADGNLVAEEVSSKAEAQQAVVNKWNKQKLKEFNKEKAAEKKAKAKEAEKAKKKAEKEAAKTMPAPKKTKSEQIGEGLLNALGIGTEGGTKSNGVNVNNKSALSELEGNTTENKRAIIEAAKKAIATLKSVFPDMDIYIHEDIDSYNEVMGKVGGFQNSAGNFVYESDANGNPTGRGRIDINLSNANARTVAHEVSHAVMLKAFGDNPALFKSFRDKISKVLNESSNKALMDFANQYVDEQGNLLDVTYEEYLAELTAALAAQEGKLSPTTLQKIAAIINDIVSKLTNGKLRPFEDIKDTKQVVEFFSNIANSIRAGEDISNINKDFSKSLYEPIPLNTVGTLENSLPPSDRKPISKSSRGDINVIPHPIVDKNTLVGKKYSATMSDHTKVGEYKNDKTNVTIKNLMGGVFYPYIKGINDAGIAWASVTVKAAREMIKNAINQDATLIYRMSRSTGSRGNVNFNEIAFAELIAPVTNGIVTEKEFLDKLNNKLNTVASGTQFKIGKYILNKYGVDTDEKLKVHKTEVIKVKNKDGKLVNKTVKVLEDGKVVPIEITKKKIPSLSALKKGLEKESFSKRGGFWSTMLKDSYSKKSTGEWYKFLEQNKVTSLEDIVNNLAESKVDSANDHDIVAAVKIAPPEYDKYGNIKIYTTRPNLVNEKKGVYFIDAPDHPSYPYVVKGSPIGILNEFNSVTDYFPIINDWVKSGRLNSPYKAVETMGKELVEKLDPTKTKFASKAKPKSTIKSKSQKGSDISIEPIDFENESENIDVYEASNTADKIAKDTGVNILRGKDLRSVALDKNGDIVGGLWTEIDGNEFSFDIAVSKTSQGRGVGEILVNDAISEFNGQNYEDQLKYKIDVTNPIMVKLLSKYGFEVVDKFTGHTIMEHPTNNPKIKSKAQLDSKIGSKEDKVWQQDPAKILKEYENAAEKYQKDDSDKNAELFDEASKERRAYQKSIIAAYSAGNISESEIKNIQTKAPSLRIDVGELKPIGNKEVYHLSVSASDIEDGGFLTKDELLKKGGKEGLGGGRGGISLTYDKKYAETLFKIFNEIKDALNGKVNIADEFKKISTKAQNQIINSISDSIGGNPVDIREAIENNKNTYLKERPYDEMRLTLEKGQTSEDNQKFNDKKVSVSPEKFIKNYYNALSMFSDLGDREWIALHTGIGKLKDADIGIFKAETKENAKGEILPAEREYHIFSGDAVKNLERITSKSQKPQNSQIKDYIESQRAAGESDADIRAGIESVADKIGLTEQDINDLMSTTAKTEDAAATQPTEEKPIKKKKRRKSLLNRAFRGTTDQKVLDTIQKYGLFYETENQAEAQKDAKEFVREVGDEAALDAVRKNLIVGGRAAFVYAQVIDNVMIDMANAKNVQEAESLLAIQGELIAEFDKRARDIGQFNSALNRVYQTSNFNYSLSRQIKKYKDMNNGVIPKEVEAKMKELETQLNEVNEQLKKAEARAKEAEEKAAIDNIKEDVNRNKEKETYTQKAKKVADKFRARFKTKPKFYDENGNEIEVFTAGFTWNDLVELAAKTIEKTGNVADGLKAVSDFVKDSDVYKKLTKKGQEALDGQINNYFGEEKTSGRVKVPHSLIRRLVEEGNTDMDSLVAAVKQELAEEYPDATDREIRDGITGYGITQEQNQEPIEKQIRKLKFIGRALSALEDIAKNKRPLKSGAQRDKLEVDERKWLKQIKEAMKDLPIDLETQDAQLKTALDAAKRRLENKIEDLDREIKTGELAKKNNKPMMTDKDYDELVARRDELQYQHDLIFKGKPQTVGEKKIKALEKQLDDLLTKEIKGQEASATFSEAEQKQIDALKEKINAAKEEMGLIASKPLPKTEMEKAEAREKAKIEALEKQLEDLRQGIIENKKDKAKTQESQEVKDLKAQIQKEKEFLGLIPANPTEIQLMEMVYDKAISDINDKIKNNDLAFKKPENKAFIPELEAKKQLLDAAKAELKKLREEAGIIEARRLENAKNSVNRRIAELERRIREKDFSKKKPTPLIKDNELIRLNAKKLRIKAEFDKLQYQNELNNRNKVQKFYDGLLEVWGLPRALLATGEFSFMLIQGGIYTLGNWRIARSSFSGAMTALANENKAKQQLKYIQAQEWYPVMKASKLALTEPDAKLEAREEQFLGGWVNYIWDIAGYPSKMGGEKLYEGWKKLNPIRAVERAGVSYLNMIRVQKFLEGSEMLQAQGKTFETHPQDYKNVADVVNTFTGRASLGKGEQFSKELSAVFFSPRNWASMIKQASPYAIYHIGKMGSREEGQSSLSLLMKGKVTPSVAQKMAVKDFLKYVAITAGFVVMAAIKYNNDDDDETEVSLDGTSSDFLKIKLGNTRVDPWGGKIQQVVLTNRIISSLSGGDGKALDYAGKMIVNKFNPSASMTYKYLNAKKDSEGLTLLDQYGNPISMKEDLWNSVRPIYWQSFAEINKENPTARAGLLHFYGFLGGGTMTYKTPTQIMKDKNVSYEDLENKDVVDFKQQIEKSEDKLSQAAIDELTATYAKEIKDLNRQFEKGLVKETQTQKALIEKKVIKEYKNDLKTVTSEEKLEKALGELKTTSEKANKLKDEFAGYSKIQKKWVAVKSISTQENKIKELIKKGIIDKAVENEFYRLMVDINAENKE